MVSCECWIALPRSGIGLQFVTVVFPDQNHFFCDFSGDLDQYCKGIQKLFLGGGFGNLILSESAHELFHVYI